MNPALVIALCVIVSYLIGSISNAVLVAKAHGVDIFKVGSGNPGATNVKRSIGKKPGNLVFFLDLLKGLVVSVWPFIPSAIGVLQTDLNPLVLSLVCLVAALVGHSFSVFIKFRGGKGVATTMGGLLAIMAPIVLLGALVWVIFFYTFRYVSLASIAFAASLPPITLAFQALGWSWPRSYGIIDIWVAVGIFLLIAARHYPNMIRLMKGTENKFQRKKSS